VFGLNGRHGPLLLRIALSYTGREEFVMFAPITKTDRNGASGRHLVRMAHRIMPVAVSAALITSMPYFAPPAFAQSDSLGELLVGQASFGDWRADAPLVRRKITELPPPYATRSASNPPRVIAKPASAVPRVPPGFQVELFATDLRDPRVLRVAPNGDIFIAESELGRIRVLRAADGAAKPSSNDVFASGLDEPFGIAFYPSGADPQWIYVANTKSVVRYPYRSGDLKASGKAEVIVRDLPHARGRAVQRGHITRDIAFSKDGRQMFV
jgi:glucose/arabinose dehydrogenase